MNYEFREQREFHPAMSRVNFAELVIGYWKLDIKSTVYRSAAEIPPTAGLPIPHSL